MISSIDLCSIYEHGMTIRLINTERLNLHVYVRACRLTGNTVCHKPSKVQNWIIDFIMQTKVDFDLYRGYKKLL